MSGGKSDLSAQSGGCRGGAGGQPVVKQAERDADAAGDGRTVPVGAAGGTLSSSSPA